MAHSPKPEHPNYWIHKRLEAIEAVVEALADAELEGQVLRDEGPLFQIRDSVERLREARGKYRP